MKKFLLTILMVSFVINAQAWNDFCIDSLVYNITSDTLPYTVEVYNYTTGIVHAIIPETVTYSGITYRVTNIDWGVFSGCTSLRSIIIGDNVEYIEHDAFANCSSLRSITIPKSVRSISHGVFSGCTSLNFVIIGDNVEYIEHYAFANCSSLRSITIPKSVRSISHGVFSGCSSLESVIFESETPPNLGHSNFDNTSVPIYVPCGCVDAYKYGGYYWTELSNIQEHPAEYSITVYSSDKTMGVADAKNSICGNQISAKANYGYHFVRWSDGNTDNPRSLVLTQDTVLTAEFTINNYTISTLCNDTERGTTSGDVTTTYLDYVTISATANYGYHFSHWDDYKYDNPRQVQVTEDKTYTAYFDKNTYYVTKNYDSNQGYVNGSTSGEYLDKITLTAEPNYGYHFVQWSDGIVDNPRPFILTQDTTFTAEFAPNTYTISSQSSDTERGTTSGDVITTYLDYATISATANYGYHFSHWDDYNYDNPRQVQVTEDKTYTAYFDKNTYYITKNYDNNQGYVNGYTSGEYLDNITLTAEPNYGYHFVRWSDGNTENPRHFVLTQDTTFAAEFAQTFSGQCGDNLYWSYQNNTLTISGFGEMNDNRPWGLFTNEIQAVVLPNGITHIGNDAFSDCTGLSEITIPYTVTSIGDYAFAGCRKLVQVNCYAINPPMAESTSFANYNVYLNVPCDNLQDYQLDMVFGSFKYIQCMGADSENVPTDDVVVTPGTTDVTITWPTEENAYTYTIVIEKDGEVFCTLTFNAEGQLLNIAFAPGRDGNRPAQYAEQAGKGYRFTVTGLEEGTDYTYDIVVKNEANQVIETHSGKFTTEPYSAVDNTYSQSSNTNCQKLFRNGQLIIVRDDVEYNAVGQEIGN